MLTLTFSPHVISICFKLNLNFVTLNLHKIARSDRIGFTTKRGKPDAAFDKDYGKQECIPVGCVPAARSPYAGVCFQGGVSGPGGCVWSQGGVSGPGEMCLVLGVCGPGGVWSGGCLVWGGGCLFWGCVVWGCLL